MNFHTNAYWEGLSNIVILLNIFVASPMQVDVKRSMEEGDSRFARLSIEERVKFDEETLVNVNNIKRKKSMSQRGDGFSNEYMVVRITLYSLFHFDFVGFSGLKREWGFFSSIIKAFLNVGSYYLNAVVGIRTIGLCLGQLLLWPLHFFL